MGGALRGGPWDPWPEPVLVETVASTMVEVADLARSGAPEGSTVVAEEQTAARGRRGRTWLAARGDGLWFSVLLRPVTDRLERVGLLPLVAGVAVAGALADAAGTATPIRVKWPNDIVVDAAAGTPTGAPPRKLGGLLAERLPDGAVVLGIGINVWQPVAALPPGATSWSAEGLAVPGARTPGGGDAVREALLVTVLAALAADYRRWSDGTWDLAEYRRRCSTLGRAVRVIREREPDLVGIAADVDDLGHLVVETEGGRVSVSAGDVSVR